jgi:dolichyl-phosphate beta-glucosyltransferase
VTAKTKSACIIVVPCFNEGARLRCSHFVDFARKAENVDILFVNDGSRNNTTGLLQAMREGREDRIQILYDKENAGKAEAVRTGLLKAIEQGYATYVGFWDGNLTTPPEVIPDFVTLLDGSSRLPRQTP